jgi:hypothetical protein
MRLKSSKLREEVRRTRQMREEAEKRWGEGGGSYQSLKPPTTNQGHQGCYINKAEHNTARDETCQVKARHVTRQDKPRQDRPRRNQPSLPPSQHAAPGARPLHTLHFFSSKFQQILIFIFLIDRHFHLPCLWSVCNAVSVHTLVTNDYLHRHPDS